MRLTDLLHARVTDSEGIDLGVVVDVRLVQDGPILDGWGAALRVEGLIVGRRTGSNLGYDRAGVRGPWLVAAIVGWLHRNDRWVPWTDIDERAPGRVTVRCQRHELEAVPRLPQHQR